VRNNAEPDAVSTEQKILPGWQLWHGKVQLALFHLALVTQNTSIGLHAEGVNLRG
jgi:hypothetical protein